MRIGNGSEADWSEHADWWEEWEEDWMEEEEYAAPWSMIRLQRELEQLKEDQKLIEKNKKSRE